MSIFGADANWARHSAIEQAMFSYFQLELANPIAAQMADQGRVHIGDAKLAQVDESSSDVFALLVDSEPLSAEHEAENQSWRVFLRASAATLAQIYFIAKGGTNDLQEHARKCVSEIVGRQWRSFKYSRHLIAEPELFDLVCELVEAQAEFEKSVQNELEVSNA